MFLNWQIYLKTVDGSPPPRKTLIDPKDLKQDSLLEDSARKKGRVYGQNLPYCIRHLNTHLDAIGGAIWSYLMDVTTAYLHAPIDDEIFVEQPQGFKTNRLLHRLNKSLYGLMQSGRNCNKMSHEWLIRNEFIQNPADCWDETKWEIINRWRSHLTKLSPLVTSRNCWCQNLKWKVW